MNKYCSFSIEQERARFGKAVLRLCLACEQGPRMVRDVFRLAKENAPAIIFIDEVDAIATARFDAQTGADRCDPHGGVPQQAAHCFTVRRGYLGSEGVERCAAAGTAVLDEADAVA